MEPTDHSPQIKSEPAEDNRQKSIKDKIRRISKYLRNRIPKKQATSDVPTEQPPVPNPEIDQKENLQQKLDKSLKEKGLNPPEFISQGVSSFFNTNEKFEPQEFAEIGKSDERANGYIVGVGVRSIFSSLELFGDTPPKGIVLLNIDPATVKDAQSFVEGLKQGKVLDAEHTKILETDVNQVATGSHYDEHRRLSGGQLPDVSTSVWQHAQLLEQMAKEGKIAVLQQDIFNPKVLETIKENLPGIESSRNAVYLSNIGDWIRRGWQKEEKEFVEQTKNLPPYDKAVQREKRGHAIRLAYGQYEKLESLVDLRNNQNYFIDSSESTINGNTPYKQRVNTYRPSFWSYNEAKIAA